MSKVSTHETKTESEKQVPSVRFGSSRPYVIQHAALNTIDTNGKIDRSSVVFDARIPRITGSGAPISEYDMSDATTSIVEKRREWGEFLFGFTVLGVELN